MSKHLWFALIALFAMLALAGCPRETGGGDTGNTTTASTPAGGDHGGAQAGTPEATADDSVDTPVDAAADEDETAKGGENTEATEDEPVEGAGEAAVENGEGEAVDGEAPADEPAKDENVVEVVFETTVGNFTIAVHKDWAPIGAEHFLTLVEEGYYTNSPFFRVLDGFMAQAGFSGDYALTSKYLRDSIKDEPQKMKNRKYTVSHGNSSMPNSRGTHIFINFVDNFFLDNAQFPYPPFGEVIEGTDVVDKIAKIGEADQGMLARENGIEMFRQQYPDATWIVKSYIKK